MLLEGKIAVVTGGGSGLGEASCKLFAENGAKVVVADYNFEKAKRVSDEINKKHGTNIPMQASNDDIRAREYRAIPIWVNVADREQVEGMVKDVIYTFGRIDILINNAGITRDAQITKMTYEDWDAVINTNLSSVFYCCKAVTPHMIEKGFGRIITTSSIIGRYGGFGQSNYAAAKAGIIGLTGTLARELGKKGINVNCVAPGYMKTPMTDAVPEKVLDSLAQKVPLKRLGQPIDIANAFLYLASDMGNYVNGATLAVDGGLVV